MLHANLIVRPLSAKIFYETSVIFKMDPFVRVKVGNQILNSPTCNMGGKTPTWSNVEMPLRVDDVLYIRFELWDRNKLTYDDMIGYGDLEFSRFVDNKFFEWVPLKRENIVAAELLVEIIIIPDKITTTSLPMSSELIKNDLIGSESSGMKSSELNIQTKDMTTVKEDANLPLESTETSSKEIKKGYHGEGFGGMQAGMMQDNAGLKSEGEK